MRTGNGLRTAGGIMALMVGLAACGSLASASIPTQPPLGAHSVNSAPRSQAPGNAHPTTEPSTPPPDAYGPASIIACQLLTAEDLAMILTRTKVVQSPDGANCSYDFSGGTINNLTFQVVERTHDKTKVEADYLKDRDSQNKIHAKYKPRKFRYAERGFQFESILPGGFSNVLCVMTRHGVTYLVMLGAELAFTHAEMQAMLRDIWLRLP